MKNNKKRKIKRIGYYVVDKNNDTITPIENIKRKIQEMMIR